jgi:L-arabinose isomerase
MSPPSCGAVRPGTTRCGTAHASRRACAGSSTDGGFTAFTTNFEDLGGAAAAARLAVQRLMADGYGFGAEGDWKTAILVRR